MIAIPFVKASACGNDFLIIDGMHAPSDMIAFARRACDRHNGVGADGVEWLFPAQDADIRARLFNADARGPPSFLKVHTLKTTPVRLPRIIVTRAQKTSFEPAGPFGLDRKRAKICIDR